MSGGFNRPPKMIENHCRLLDDYTDTIVTVMTGFVSGSGKALTVNMTEDIQHLQLKGKSGPYIKFYYLNILYFKESVIYIFKEEKSNEHT